MFSERRSLKHAGRVMSMARGSKRLDRLFPSKGTGRFFLDEPGERLLEADDIAWDCGKDDIREDDVDAYIGHQTLSNYLDDFGEGH